MLVLHWVAMRRLGLTGGGDQQVLRRFGVVALVIFAIADALLITLAVRHNHRTTNTAVVAIGTSPAGPSTSPPAAQAVPTAVALAAGQVAVATSSYGTCHDGYVTIDDERLSGVSKVLAVTGVTAPAVFVGQDKTCTLHVWSMKKGSWVQADKLTVPSGPTTAAKTAAWVIGPQTGLVIGTDGKVLSHPKNPCLNSTSQLTASSVVAWSAKRADVFCSKPATAAGQLRLVYATTDGGSSWSEYAGARALGPSAKGRKDGLDGDGQLVATGAIGEERVGALLANAGCDGVQLRTSVDGGRNWKIGGCLPTQVPSAGITLGGTPTAVVVVAVTETDLITYQSADNGKTWTAAP
jgi:hypothetical protein